MTQNNDDNKDVKKNKFHKGKIYKITSGKSNLFYIGSTCSTLNRRFMTHHRAFKYGCLGSISSFKLLELGDAKIELIENFKCETGDELRAREGELIRQHRQNLVNIRIPGRTRQQFRDEEKEHLKNYRREYRLKNLQKIREQERLNYRRKFQRIPIKNEILL